MKGGRNPVRIPAMLALSMIFLPAPARPQTTTETATQTASSVLSPSLAQLRQSLRGLRVDKWKAPGPVREDANSNIVSMTRDLDGTLPGLLATADAAPGVVSRNLPVFRNVDALYDVLLRVVETAELAAPENEAGALRGALASLEDARRSLGDTLQTAAESDEQQIARLREQMRTQAAAPAAPATVVDDGAKPAAPAHRKKAAAKPAAPPASSPQPAPE